MKYSIIFFLSVLTNFSLGQNWISLNGGLACPKGSGDEVLDLDFDQALGRLNVAGTFDKDYYCNEYRSFAYWNENNWQPYPEACNIQVHTITKFQNQLYSVGDIDCSIDNSYLYRLEDSQWISVDGGPDEWGFDRLVVIGEKLYGGGSFENLGNTPAKVLFSYDGNEFTPLVTEQLEQMSVTSITGITEFQDTLYVNGNFHCDGCSVTNRISDVAAVYNDSLHQVGIGLNTNSTGEAMCVHRDTLFIGGIFGDENFPDFNTNNEFVYLLSYANGELKPYPVQPSNRITALKSYNDLLFVGGWFDLVEGEINPCVFALNGTEVITLNTEQFFNTNNQAVNSVRDLEIFADTLYVSGGWHFIGESDVPFGGIAKLNLSLSSLVGVSESEASVRLFQLYPNPASTQITLKGLTKHTYYDLHIYDSSGRIVCNHPHTNETNFNIEHLQNGVYFITVVSNDLVYQMRFVKE